MADYVSVPLIGFTTPKKTDAFLGSACFVDSGEYLVTAYHVVRDWKKRIGFTVPLVPPRMFEAKVVACDPAIDLALLKVDGYRPDNPFPLADPESIISNSLVACHEYGPTEVAGGVFRLEPATRLGNVTRIRDLRERFGKAGDDMLELSFPALRGASGAAVVHWLPPFELVGIIVANVSHHLMPAQVLSVLDERNEILEETHFMLPQALAVNVKHLHEMIIRQRRQRRRRSGPNI